LVATKSKWEGGKWNPQASKRRLGDCWRSCRENSTWDDLMQEIYVRQAIEAGLADSQAGRTTDVEQVRSRFGLTK